MEETHSGLHRSGSESRVGPTQATTCFLPWQIFLTLTGSLAAESHKLSGGGGEWPATQAGSLMDPQIHHFTLQRFQLFLLLLRARLPTVPPQQGKARPRLWLLLWGGGQGTKVQPPVRK